MKQIIGNLIKDYEAADMVLIGIGSELHKNIVGDDEKLNELLEFYAKKLDKKNYFIITTHGESMFSGSKFNPKRICEPIANMTEEGEKQWDFYNKWLAATLNKKLLIIELGEDFNRPNVFRWPFEKIVSINLKSKMYRVHNVFYQLPENITDRAYGIECNALKLIEEIKDYIS